MEEVSCKRGSVIFNEGDPGASMYVVLSGKVKIVKKARGVDKTLAVFGPGDFFGEMAIISGKTRSASAVAEEDCRLQVLERHDFLNMVQCNRKEDRMTLSVMEKLCDRLRDTDLQIENLLIGDHLNRVADALAQMKAGVSVGDVAGRVGLTKERVGGIVAKLAAAGGVSAAGERIESLNEEKLRKYRDILTQIVDLRGEDDTLRIHRLLKSARPGTWLSILGDSSALESQTRKMAESMGYRVIESVATGDGEWQATVEV